MAAPVVLVVEQNSELRHVLREALAAEGYEALTAHDDTDAVELLRSRPVSLLVRDIAPRGAGLGLETLVQEFPDLRVLLTAERGHPELLASSWKGEGRYRTLPKPFRLGELLAASRELLGPPADRAQK